jgi:hypothetical protein
LDVQKLMSALLRRAGIRQRSDKQVRRDAVQAKAKRVILARAGGRCDVGGESTRDLRIDHHHIFGTSWLGLPWSDSSEAGAAVCREHHDFVQTHPASEEQAALELTACGRLMARLRAEGGSLRWDGQVRTNRRAALDLVRELEALGVEP